MTQEVMQHIRWTADFEVNCFDDIRGGYNTTNRTRIYVPSQEEDASLSKDTTGRYTQVFSRTGIDIRAYNSAHDYSIQLFIRNLSSNTLSAKIQFTNFKIGNRQLPVEFRWNYMR